MTEQAFFDAHQRATIEAAMARIIPTDDTPGAREARHDRLPRPLPVRHRLHLRQARRQRVRAAGRQARARPGSGASRSSASKLRRGRRGARPARPASASAPTSSSSPATSRTRCCARSSGAARSTQERRARARTDAALRRARGGRRCSRRAPRSTSTSCPCSSLHTRQGFYADPIYGGNRDRVGWKVIGFPGPASLAEVHTGRYSTLEYFAEHPGTRTGGLTVAPTHKPERADVCIIGAGASGAAAAKVLTERGVRVVALERGPWRTRETLRRRRARQRQPLQPLAGPAAQPAHRAHRRPDGDAASRAVLPGAADGRRRHGPLAGLAAALHRRTTSACAPSSATCPGATLADWPITYDELEPYYDKVEWAFGVSGQAGANAFEGPRSRGYPCPPMPMSRYAQKFHEGCAALGWNSFPTPAGGAVPPVQRPPGDGRSAPSPSSTATRPAPARAR